MFDDSDATEEDEPTDDAGRPMPAAPSEEATDPATAMAALEAADEALASKAAANTAAIAQNKGEPPVKGEKPKALEQVFNDQQVKFLSRMIRAVQKRAQSSLVRLLCGRLCSLSLSLSHTLSLLSLVQRNAPRPAPVVC